MRVREILKRKICRNVSKIGLKGISTEAFALKFKAKVECVTRPSIKSVRRIPDATDTPIENRSMLSASASCRVMH
jgi:hypothetical protein